MQLFVNAVLSAQLKHVLLSPPYRSVSNNLKTCSGSHCWCVPCHRVQQSKDKSSSPCSVRIELLEDEWLGDEQTGSTPLLLSLAVNADSHNLWLLPALAPQFWPIPLSV